MSQEDPSVGLYAAPLL